MLSKLKAILNPSGYLQRLFLSNEDPIDASKKLVNSIQQWVGINDVFGDKELSCSVSLLGIPLFLGAFFYVGPFSQMVYLVQVLPDKIESFKALNCLSATTIPMSTYIFMWLSRSHQQRHQLIDWAHERHRNEPDPRLSERLFVPIVTSGQPVGVVGFLYDKGRLKHVFMMCRHGMNSLPEGSVSQSALLRTLRKAQYLAWLVLLNQLITHVCYLVIPFVMTLVDGNERYLPSTPGETYGLSPKYETPYYEATFALTLVATCFSVFNQTGYTIIFISIIAHELGHYYAIAETLIDLRDKLSVAENENSIRAEDMETVTKETLTFCIKQHQFITQLHTKIRDLYKAIFGAHFLTMTAVLVTTLQTLGAWDIRNTILTGVTGVLPLFIYCFGGELLISARIELTSALYDCGWEMMSVKQARIVLFMLRISQQPLNLTAAGIFVMNRETFGDVAQVVYKVYTVFN